jgi:hypothetical protein
MKHICFYVISRKKSKELFFKKPYEWNGHSVNA